MGKKLAKPRWIKEFMRLIDVGLRTVLLATIGAAAYAKRRASKKRKKGLKLPPKYKKRWRGKDGEWVYKY